MNDLTQIKLATFRHWVATSALKVTDIGEENVYGVDMFDHVYFAKHDDEYAEGLKSRGAQRR